ncbi:MAG TPA: hypothetical protein VGM54_13035 [Chthoniobacter sp.]
MEIAAQDNVNSKGQQFELASKRVAQIPADARSNSDVAAGLKKFEETAAKLSKESPASKRSSSSRSSISLLPSNCQKAKPG